MPLSNQVEDSLRESQECLRNALAYSARNEKPYISKHIADMLMTIDSLIDMEDMIEKIEHLNGDP